MTPIRVTVTQEDVDGASRLSAFNCPVARAIKRCTWLREVGVTRRYIRIVDTGDLYETPPEAQAFVKAWDDHADLPPLPIVFELTTPFLGTP